MARIREIRWLALRDLADGLDEVEPRGISKDGVLV
jgi:hypothetical protein